MEIYRFSRILIALLLVCCLVVNISPIKAEAAALTVSTVGVGTVIVIGSILIGLGLLPDVDTSVFTTTVNNIISSLNLAETIELTTWVVSGFQKYAVPNSLIDMVRSFIFDQALAYHVPPENGISLDAGETLNLAFGRTYTPDNYCEVFCAQGIYSGKGNFNFISNEPFSVNGTAATYFSGLYSYFVTDVSTSNWTGYIYPYSPYGAQGQETFTNSCSSSYRGPALSVSEGFVAGEIAQQNTSLDVGYVNWAAGSVPLYLHSDGSYYEEPETEEQDPIPFWPVGIDKTYDETISNTQSQVQAGESTYEVPSTDTDTDIGGVTSGISESWLSQKFDSLTNAISGFFSQVISSIEAIPGAFTKWFDDLLTGIESIPGTILSGIEAIFVPSEDFLTAKVEALRTRFDFINPFIEFIDSFKGQFSSGSPPVIYVHLEDAEGSYNYGGTVPFLDMSWYSRYKGTGDAIISGFLWALFGWRMYLKLPGIINGVSGSVGSMSSKYRDGDD